MINRGRKVLDDPVSSIQRRYDTRAVRLEPLDPAADIARVRALPEVDSCAASEGGYDVALHTGADVAGAIARIAAAIPVARIEVKRPRLEDVFVQIVAEGGTEAAERTRGPDIGTAARANV
jgi:ABC-type uncharacterized transport system ATPase subunit